mmetsp:Transcript_11868/g.28484  ORF Transcript_11868/g.28484 Transcript_11868/m.28484 type:complete len:224 (-) Transcript_11868:42-713(-)
MRPSGRMMMRFGREEPLQLVLDAVVATTHDDQLVRGRRRRGNAAALLLIAALVAGADGGALVALELADDGTHRCREAADALTPADHQTRGGVLPPPQSRAHRLLARRSLGAPEALAQRQAADSDLRLVDEGLLECEGPDGVGGDEVGVDAGRPPEDVWCLEVSDDGDEGDVVHADGGHGAEEGVLAEGVDGQKQVGLGRLEEPGEVVVVVVETPRLGEALEWP